MQERPSRMCISYCSMFNSREHKALTSSGASFDCSCTLSIQILPPPSVGIFDLANGPQLLQIL